MKHELFSIRLANYRDAHNLTQTEMGQALGVSQRYVAALEAGEKDPDANSSLAKLFALMEAGQIPPPASQRQEKRVMEEPATYHVGRVQNGLNVQDAIAQIRADIAMMEGGSQSDKRRAYHFLRDVHLPLLASVLKIE